MSTLALQQQALLDALFARPRTVGASPHSPTLHTAQSMRGLAAYQANGRALAARCLLAAYPVVAQLLGEQNLHGLASALWQRYPPVHGDLARWGDALPAFLASNEQLTDLPYLADVARVEWALHQAAGATDADHDLPSLARLATEDPSALTLALAPGTAVISSDWPVASLVNAHTWGQPELAEAGRLVQQRVGESAVVWRQGFKPSMAPCSSCVADLLRALLAAVPLTEALACASTDQGTFNFDFADWLTQAVHSGLVIGVAPMTSLRQSTEKTT